MCEKNEKSDCAAFYECLTTKEYGTECDEAVKDSDHGLRLLFLRLSDALFEKKRAARGFFASFALSAVLFCLIFVLAVFYGVIFEKTGGTLVVSMLFVCLALLIGSALRTVGLWKKYKRFKRSVMGLQNKILRWDDKEYFEFSKK